MALDDTASRLAKVVARRLNGFRRDGSLVLGQAVVGVLQQRPELEVLVKVESQELGEDGVAHRIRIRVGSVGAGDRSYQLPEHGGAQRALGLLALIDQLQVRAVLLEVVREPGRDDRAQRHGELHHHVEPELDVALGLHFRAAFASLVLSRHARFVTGS